MLTIQEEIKTQDKKLADLKDQLANMPSSNGGFFEGLKT
jgi:hypothetical protein